MKGLVIILAILMVLVTIGFTTPQYTLDVPAEYEKLGYKTYDFTQPIKDSVGTFNKIGDMGKEVLEAFGIIQGNQLTMKLITYHSASDTTKKAYVLVLLPYDFDKPEIIAFNKTAYKVYAYQDISGSGAMEQVFSTLKYYPGVYTMGIVDPYTTFIGKSNLNGQTIPFDGINLFIGKMDLESRSNNNTDYVFESITLFDMTTYYDYEFTKVD